MTLRLSNLGVLQSWLGLGAEGVGGCVTIEHLRLKQF